MDGKTYSDLQCMSIVRNAIAIEGAVRLVSGVLLSTTNPGGPAGRLEIYLSGEWGTICDEGFDQTDADVACQQLGFDMAYSFGSVESLGYVR